MTTHSVRRLPRAPYSRWSVAAATVVSILVGMLALLAPAAPAYADDGGFAAKMLELVNQERATAGLAPVQASPVLTTVATDGQYTGCGFPVSGRATDMGVRNYFGHSILGCGTKSVFDILGALNLATSTSGENIAWMNGTTDPLIAAQNLMSSLMASPGHKANILNPDFNTIGIGSWHSDAGQTWSGTGTPLTRVFIGVQVFAHMAVSTPAPTPTPAAPTNVKATGGDGSIAVSWTPAAGGSTVDAYGAFAWDAAGYTNHYVSVCATCSTGTVTGLPDGHPYYVTVYGHNASGWGAPGFSGWVTVAAVPGAPTSVSAVPANAAMTASWVPPTNPGTAIDGYGVFAYDANGYTNQYAWVCATCTTATVAGLVNGRAYYYMVYAHNPNGWGTPTTSGWIVAGTPGPAANVAVAPAAGSVKVSWSPAANSGSAIDVYGLFAFDASGYTGLYAATCATCTTGTITGLTSGKRYTVVVYAHNALGWGVPISSSSVTPA